MIRDERLLAALGQWNVPVRRSAYKRILGTVKTYLVVCEMIFSFLTFFAKAALSLFGLLGVRVGWSDTVRVPRVTSMSTRP